MFFCCSSTVCVPSEPDITQDVTPHQASVKLPSGQSLTASQIFDAITNESHSIVDSIPNGFKDNLFFCLTIVKTFTVAKFHNTVHLPTVVGHGTHSGRTTKEHIRFGVGLHDNVTCGTRSVVGSGAF
jgi:hypothetical protein